MARFIQYMRNLKNILESDNHRREKLAKEQGWRSSNFHIEIGEHPVIQYFSGCFHIAESQAEVGSVKLANRISHSFGESHGVHINNEITITLVF